MSASGASARVGSECCVATIWLYCSGPWTHAADGPTAYGFCVGPIEHDVNPRAVTIVTSSGCHLCETAKDTVSAVAQDHELRIRIVDLTSQEGRQLAQLHRMPFPPMILIDGQVHAHGRLSEKKLRRFLERSPQPIVDGR